MGCTDRLLRSVGIKCAVNFEIAKDASVRRLIATDKPREVMVIGGGVAGMEASRILALRGHKVTLYEKEAKLGGTTRLVAAMPRLLTQELMRVVYFLRNELEKHEVRLELGREVTLRTVETVSPDVVILATGSLPSLPKIPGTDKQNVFTFADFLRRKANIGREVIVMGGNHGAEISLSLAKEGKKVTIVEESSETATTPYITLPRRLALQGYLEEEKVGILTESRVKEITDGGVVIVDRENIEKTIAGDTVIIALGGTPDNDLARRLEGNVSNLHQIGDCVESGSIMSAIHQAALVARQV
jgi:2-enoate reductase